MENADLMGKPISMLDIENSVNEPSKGNIGKAPAWRWVSAKFRYLVLATSYESPTGFSGF